MQNPISDLVRSACPSKGIVHIMVCVEDKFPVAPVAAALARSFPLFTKKTSVCKNKKKSKQEDDNDDEEDESEDHHSTFTISSDDSDNSSDDESGVKFRKTTKSKRHENKKTSSGGQRPTTKPAAKRKPNTKHNQTKSRSKATAFSKNRDTLTSHTFSEFNLKAFEGALSSVTVTWSNKLNTTAGITRMRGKLGKDNAHTRVATIELATKVIDNEERLRSTLLHEMCHAAQWLVDGIHKPPHGAQFKKWANISMRKIRDVEVTTTHDYQISYKYAWVSA